jgi:hypothetical protein
LAPSDRLDRGVALGGTSQRVEVLDPPAQLVALAGDAPLVPHGGIEQADEPGDDRAERQHDHEADVALVAVRRGYGHADRNEKATDERAARAVIETAAMSNGDAAAQ